MGKASLGGDRYLIWGNLTRDAEKRSVGSSRIDKTTFKVADRGEGDETEFYDLEAWRGMALYCESLRKGQGVMAICHLELGKNLRRDGTPWENYAVDFIVPQPMFRDSRDSRDSARDDVRRSPQKTRNTYDDEEAVLHELESLDHELPL